MAIGRLLLQIIFGLLYVIILGGGFVAVLGSDLVVGGGGSGLGCECWVELGGFGGGQWCVVL